MNAPRTALPSKNLPPPVDYEYLLVTHIPYFVDHEGRVWLPRLWQHDLAAHLIYLRRLTLAGPQHNREEAGLDNLVEIRAPAGTSLRFVPLPKSEPMRRAVLRLPRLIAALWRAIGQAEIVHSGVVGWPFPVGWIANVIAVLRRRPLIMVIEGAPWRQERRGKAWASLSETMARWSVNHSSVTFFTQPSYRQTLLTRAKTPSFVIPASWIDEDAILADASARESWHQKKLRTRRKMLFVGRLIAEKGVETLLAAIEMLGDGSAAIDVGIVGEGPLRARCVVAAQDRGQVRVSVLDPLPYGEDFLELLRGYDALIIPSLGDEQPRVLFDAYSQAIPVIASSTDGLRPYVSDGSTGWLVPPGDARSLAETIAKAAASPGEAERRGLAALERARTTTHQQMHLTRWSHLVDLFGPTRPLRPGRPRNPGA